MVIILKRAVDLGNQLKIYSVATRLLCLAIPGFDVAETRPRVSASNTLSPVAAMIIRYKTRTFFLYIYP
jgi:hypothetical protein